jgi:ectoine hydroxylase
MKESVMSALDTVASLKKHGLAFIRQSFNKQEIAVLNHRINSYSTQGHPGIVYEENSRNIRGLHGVHLYDELFKALIRDPRLLTPAVDFLGEPAYVHQLKINYKKKLVGEGWPWHQDYIYWQEGDGIKSSRMLNVAIMLDDISPLNGPLCMIPNSHVHGELSDVRYRLADDNAPDNYNQDVSKKLTYQVGGERVQSLLDENGYDFATGKAGDILLFDPLLVHCSSGNLSPVDRKLLIITYNPASNPPSEEKKHSRPEYLCARNYSPLLHNGDFKIEAQCQGD